MQQSTFSYLCEKLRPAIIRQNTHLRKAISVEQRVAITLWCLATPCEYRTVAHLFGVAHSTVCMIVHEPCLAITNKIYISFPTGESLNTVINGFEHKWGFPQCVGAIDGCHVPISAPLMNHTDYYNRKGWYSMIIQAIVDHDYIFRDICVGWPGSVHDARVFANSLIYKKITEEQLLDNVGNRTILGRQIKPCLVGDSAYPMHTWLVKPFNFNSSLTAKQKHFNYRLSRARIVVENTFGRLKARWRRLMKRNDMSTENIPTVITACCILHNICEIHGEYFNDSWLADNTEYEQPSSSMATHTALSGASHEVRNTLMEYLFSQQ